LSNWEQIPKEERPREKLLQEGVSKLSNQELLALLLRTGTKKENVLDLAQKILFQFEGLRLLKDASYEELVTTKGIGEAKAITLLAAIELGSRIFLFQTEQRPIIKSPSDAANILMPHMRFLTQENFVVLYLNTKNHVIHKQTIFIGGLNSSLVHPREVFKEALRRSAASIICAHNHPSGVRLSLFK